MFEIMYYRYYDLVCDYEDYIANELFSDELKLSPIKNENRNTLILFSAFDLIIRCRSPTFYKILYICKVVCFRYIILQKRAGIVTFSGFFMLIN